ncbi:hypothetical protein Tco_0633719 [Tanacetum coccineum]
MRTRSSSNLVGNSSSNPTTSNPKRHNRRRSNQRVKPFSLEESPVVTMVDQRTMAELLCAPTEGYAEAIVVPPSLVKQNMMTSDQFFGLEKDNPHDHIRWFNKITSTIKYKDVPNHAIKLMLFSFLTCEGSPPFDKSFHEAWDRYKDLLRACPRHGFTELHQLDTFYNALNPSDHDSLNSAAGGNLLERSTQDVLTIIENKSKVRNSRNKSIVSQVKSSDGNSSSNIAKLTHAVNQQTSAVTTAMTAILKQFQATPPPASIKAIEEICVTYGGPHPYYQCLAVDGNTFLEYRDNIQGYVAAATGNYNQGNASYRPPGVVNQTRPPGFIQQNGQNNQNRFSQPQGYNRGNNFNQNPTYQAPIQQNQNVPLNELEKFKKTNEANMKAMQAQINNVKNELRNEMQYLIQASMSNQTNELKNMMASFFQMNTASTSGTGSLPSNTIANPKGELKAITTRSGLILDGPTEEFKAYLASDSFPPGNSNPSFLLPPFHNSLSGSTTSSSPSLHISEISDYFLKEFVDELSHITFPPGNDDLPFDAESDLRELDYLLNHDPIKEMDSILEDSVDENSLDEYLVDNISEMFTDEHALDFSSPPLWDDYDDELFDLETINDDTYDDPFDSKEEKIKDSKILIDELDLP